MSQYIAHILSVNADSINVYELVKDKNSINITSFDELNELDESDQLLVLIPSSMVTSYEFKQNKSLSEQINIANFISEVDSVFAEDVSSNECFLHNDAAYVVDKNFLKDLNVSLSKLSAQVHVIPEYLLNILHQEDAITEFEDNFFISYSNKTGFTTNFNSLEQYLEIILNENPNFNPVIFSSKNLLTDRFYEKPLNKLFKINDINLPLIKTLPNFFRLQISLNLFINKMNLSKHQIILGLISLFLLIAAPKYLIYQNNTYTNIYTSSTFDIFKGIDKDVKRVISPKSQIDQLLKQAPTTDLSSIKLPDLDLFLKYGSKYISDISINIDTSEATIQLNSMPDLQFNILKNNSQRFNVNIDDSDIIFNNSSINGALKIKYKNE
jgi:hypothetical protein